LAEVFDILAVLLVAYGCLLWIAVFAGGMYLASTSRPADLFAVMTRRLDDLRIRGS